MNRKEIGAVGERQAADLLRAKGYKIIDMNFSCKLGEIDIIAKKGYMLTFVEVKTRNSFEFGMPAEAVDSKKMHHIRNAATFYIQKNKLFNVSYKFDVIEIMVNHIENAF